MKEIGMVSDLHMDIHPQLDLPGGDVLLIAGDTAECQNFKDTEVHYHFHKICEKYRRVFLIFGNHEHYNSVFHNSRTVVEQSALPKNVHILEKQVTNISPGWMLFGATMWTSMGRMESDDWGVHQAVKRDMNDFAGAIHIVDRDDHVIRRFTTYDAKEEFKRTLEVLSEQLIKHYDKRFVVMTHHAPSGRSTDPRYKNEVKLNCGYYSPLESFIKQHPQIRFWQHGHMHAPADYMVGECRVICNPRGYVGYSDGENPSFNPALTIQLEDYSNEERIQGQNGEAHDASIPAGSEDGGGS